MNIDRMIEELIKLKEKGVTRVIVDLGLETETDVSEIIQRDSTAYVIVEDPPYY